MNPPTLALLGPERSLLFHKLVELGSSLESTCYDFMDLGDYQQILKEDPKEGLLIYWKEMLSRSHLVASSSILRNTSWLKGMLVTHENKLFLPFSAAFRGFIESTTDSFDALASLPLFLAENRKKIERVLSKKAINSVFASADLEDTLIHFTHARKIRRGDTAPASHKAKYVREYLNTVKHDDLVDFDIAYSRLCELTHPAASSVQYLTKNFDENHFELANNADEKALNALAIEYSKHIEELFAIAFNPAVMTLKVLNRYSLKQFHCNKVKTWDLSAIPNWKIVNRHLKN